MKVPYMILLRPQFKYALAIAVLAILPLGLACNRAAPAAAEQPVPKVTVSAVVSQETIDADEYTGQTEASEIVEVRARVFGYLKSIEFKDGDYVKEGQTLFTIEPDEYEATHQQSLSKIDLNSANLELAKKEYARSSRLANTGAASREELEVWGGQAIDRGGRTTEGRRSRSAD